MQSTFHKSYTTHPPTLCFDQRFSINQEYMLSQLTRQASKVVPWSIMAPGQFNERKSVANTLTALKRWSCQPRELPRTLKHHETLQPLLPSSSTLTCRKLSLISERFMYMTSTIRVSGKSMIMPWLRLPDHSSFQFSKVLYRTLGYGTRPPLPGCRTKRSFLMGGGGTMSAFWEQRAMESKEKNQERGQTGGTRKL